MTCEDDVSVCDENAACLYNECICLPGFHKDGNICAGFFFNILYFSKTKCFIDE